ncbi:MAG: immunity 53 family protein [Sedimenticola sp.]
MTRTLDRIMAWYSDQCNDDWEHSYGVKIDTLDNPGWSIEIDLEETNYANKDFSIIDIQRNDRDWVYCDIRDRKFKGAGGIGNLEELLLSFLNWVDE